MLMWILIIFALALIFGIIKVENLKEWYAKGLEFVQTNLNKGKSEAKNEPVSQEENAQNNDKAE